MKIGLVASSGGHLTQLLRLSYACQGYKHFFVTAGVALEPKFASSAVSYPVVKANRKSPLLLFTMLIQVAHIFLKERPDVVMSTGAAAGCLFCLMAKAFGKKVVWVDTVSHVDRLTLSGRIIINIADLFLVQWPDLAAEYKKAEYAGTLL